MVRSFSPHRPRIGPRNAPMPLSRHEAEAKRTALRGMILDAIESGPPGDTDIDTFIDELNAKLDRR